MSRLRPLSFGAEPTGARMARIQGSPHFADGVFVNPTGPSQPPRGPRSEVIRTMLRKADRVRRRPAGPVPVHPTTLADLARPPASGLRLTWMGHSSVLAEIDGRRVLFDPVWGERCSPFAFVGPAPAAPGAGAAGRADPARRRGDLARPLRPPRHAHHPARWSAADAVFAVPLGVGAHLEHWGVPADRLRELDWNESAEIGRPHPDRHPGPALLRPRPAQHASTPCGPPGSVPRHRAPDLPQRRHRLLPRLRRHRRRSTARSTPR